jgi:hypothetical protein
MDLTDPRWRKSSYSSGNGGACVEAATLGAARWQKSSYSGGNGGACVEVARGIDGRPGVVAVRDSKDPHGPHLDFTPADWQAFTARIKGGALGH